MTEQRLPTPITGGVRDLLRTENVKQLFEEVLRDRAPQFLAALAQLVYNTPGMDECEPTSVWAAALTAATLDLSIDKNLGQAWIIPYNDNKAGCKKAQFQTGYKGYIQLAHRTNQYQTIHVTEIYEGEVRGLNRFTGLPIQGERTGNTVIGYLGYFKLVNGFEKYLYMTVAELNAFGQKYSKSYSRDSSLWKTNPSVMYLKTIIKQLLTKWGVLSTEMQRALSSEVVEEEPDEPIHILPPEQLRQSSQSLYGDDPKPASAPAPSWNGNGNGKLASIGSGVNPDRFFTTVCESLPAYLVDGKPDHVRILHDSAAAGFTKITSDFDPIIEALGKLHSEPQKETEVPF